MKRFSKTMLNGKGYSNLKREVEMLHEIGLDESEIQYLVHLRRKQLTRSHWH
jgi:hypothetical protein